MAKFHQIAEKFSQQRENPFTLPWHFDLAKQILPYIDKSEQQLLQAELQYQQQQNYKALPSGIIDMDLFPDNVLFVNDNLTGLLDFYFACNDSFLLDLAVTMNAWSLSEAGLRNICAETILVHYQVQRPLTLMENQQLSNMRCYAALHFWLTRLRDKYLVPSQTGVLVKNPSQFAEMLKVLRDNI